MITRFGRPGRLAAVALTVGLGTGLVAVGGLVACGEPSPEELVEGKPWRVTVYYTAVESFHGGPRQEVTGCLTTACEHGEDSLGEYPRSFADRVKEEGSGRITSGAHAGQYLNWSYDIGYWLDSAPRNAHGGVLEPFRSAAADGVPDGTRLRLVECGEHDSGGDVPADVCEALRAGQWQIQDVFTPGLGGAQHIDLYIGEEREPDFTTNSQMYISLRNAALTVER